MTWSAGGQNRYVDPLPLVEDDALTEILALRHFLLPTSYFLL